MPLLTIQDLTVRFGGLTAVQRVSCQVRRGEIYSIIGPNGAGKTTVFNAITGIFDPSEGSVAFEGRPLRRQRTWKAWIGILGSAIGLGLAAMLLSVNVDHLWHAALKRNYPSSIPLTGSQVLHDAWAYLHGEPGIEPSGKNWDVVSADSLNQFAGGLSREQAETLRGQIVTLFHASVVADTPTPDGDHWSIMADGQPVDLGQWPDAQKAQTFVDRVRVASVQARTHWNRALVMLGLGMLVGGVGYSFIWNRARRTPDVIALNGIARTFQNIRLFQNMSVLENVLIGLDRSLSRNVLAMLFRTPGLKRQEAQARRRALEILDLAGLSAQANNLAKNLPYGQQRRLEIARALATEPKLILLDEPAAGMNPTESHELAALIRQIRDRGLTILLIEHHMRIVMGISDRVAVLEHGVKIAEGTPAEVRANPAVIKAYLGSEEVT